VSREESELSGSSWNPPSQVVLHAYDTLVVSQFPQHRRGVVVDTGRQPVTAIQQAFFRAGHAHEGVLVILALVGQILIDATSLFGPLDQLA
jgi:hypothetical protein